MPSGFAENTPCGVDEAAIPDAVFTAKAGGFSRVLISENKHPGGHYTKRKEFSKKLSGNLSKI